jgi:hypothetical protein
MSIKFDKNYFNQLTNLKINRPQGQLSGHNSGEPFCDEIYKFLKEKNKNNIFKQYEYLNQLLSNNKSKKTPKERQKLFTDTFGFIVNRGTTSLKNWSTETQFEEKQNDTADIIYIDNQEKTIIDVKTKNISKKGQPPNIISGYKMAQVAESLINKNDGNKIDINYIGIDWELNNNFLDLKEIVVKDLFKISPDKLYINWAAALQIQFDVSIVDQNYKKDKKNWATDYLKMYIASVQNRKKILDKKFKNPFLYLISD